MGTPVGQTSPTDPTPPTVVIDNPINSATVSDIITVTADAADNVGVGGVSFFVDGNARGVEDTADPYAFNWDTRAETNGAHTLTALARDVNGNTKLSAPVTVNVANVNHFQNEILATGLQSSDRHEIPSRRPNAGGGVRGDDQGIAAALYARPTRRHSCN